MWVKYLNNPMDARAVGDVAIYNSQLRAFFASHWLVTFPLSRFYLHFTKRKKKVDSRIYKGFKIKTNHYLYLKIFCKQYYAAWGAAKSSTLIDSFRWGLKCSMLIPCGLNPPRLAYLYRTDLSKHPVMFS